MSDEPMMTPMRAGRPTSRERMMSGLALAVLIAAFAGVVVATALWVRYVMDRSWTQACVYAVVLPIVLAVARNVRGRRGRTTSGAADSVTSGRQEAAGGSETTAGLDGRPCAALPTWAERVLIAAALCVVGVVVFIVVGWVLVLLGFDVSIDRDGETLRGMLAAAVMR